MNATRPFLWTLAALAATVVVGRFPASAADAPKRPNVLFVFTDDHASHAISAYGSKVNQTPHIDRLATEGMIFQNCFVTNSICAPSRAVIQTGKHSHVNGVIDNAVEFDTSQQTFPKLLQKAGYQTAIIGKWHLKAEPTGFDYWRVLVGQGTYYNPRFRTPDGPFNPTGYTTDVITDLALEWLDKGRDPSKPFMLMYQHKAPHREWLPGPDHLTMYDDVEIPEPPTLFDDYTGRTSAALWASMTIARHMNDLDLKLVLPRYLNDEQRERIEAAYRPKNEAMRKANLQGKDLVRWKYQRYLKDYLRAIASVDDNLGRVLEYLDRSGLAQNTVVIYNSDQGFYLGDHGWFDKRWMYEESLRMPLLVRWPGVVKPGSENRDLVQNLDFAETFLDVAGVPVPDDMQGRSLVPLLKGQTPNDWRKSVYYHYYEFPGWHDVARHYGVRTDRHKLVHYYDVGEWELFDLQKDPDELGSVYDDPAYAGVVAELKAELGRLRKENGADRFEEPPAPPVPANVELELVLHYEPTLLEDGRIADASGKGHHGKRQNVEVVDVAEAPGWKAMEFSGNGAVVVEPPPESLDPTYRPLTVGAWCKPKSGDGVIVAHGNQTFGYSLYLKDRVPHFAVRLSGLLLEVRGRNPVDLDRWVHLAATIDPERRITLFVGGEEAGRLAEGHFVTQPPREALNVGADLRGRVGEYDTPMHFRGLIRRVRVYWGVMDDFYAWCSPRVSAGDYATTRDRCGPWIVAPGGKPVLRYMTQNPVASKLTANSVSCFHPVCTPSGEVVTAFAPGDHLHHRGVFLAWYKMTGPTEADFWGWGQFAPTEGRVIEAGDWRMEGKEDRVTMHVRSRWLANRAPMIHEDLSATVRQQGPANVIDLTYTLNPTADVTIDRSAFGGFCVRCRNDGEITFTGPDGPLSLPSPHHLKPETDWPAASGYDLSIKLADGKTVGMAVLDHPENPPSGWHNVARLAMINPCVTAAGPITLTKGEPFVLRYRLVAHDGPAPVDLLQTLSAEWR
ncbi:MAG TPA: sulfatase/phosphatase domain-containing protein [Thermoguttaceae bacterium]|nr:sulfatase/phosphatase domain-containing protein [Thermoguttaceae bacterium]